MRRRPILCHFMPVELLEQRFLFDTTLDIAGVQPAAFDQPQIYEILRQGPDADPLQVVDDSGDQVLGTIQAFLDTGTSGNVLSEETASALGLANSTFGDPPQDVFFDDVGVAGDQPFNVSDPLYPSFAPFPQDPQDGTDQTTYSPPGGPTRFELNPTPIDDGDDSGLDFEDPVDIAGMTMIDGKVMVMDPRPTDDIDYMNTYLYAPGTPFNAATEDTDPGIPDTSYHVKVSTVDFSQFTSLFPDGAPGPTLAGNPMIGPNPVAEFNGSPPDSTPPVTIQMNGFPSTTGSFLFDTGSAASFISQNMASRVHVYYSSAPDHAYLSDNPMLVDDSGQPIANQFTLAIGGTASPVTVAGFFLDSMTLPATDSSGASAPISFLGAPVLVLDVTLQDPNTGDGFVLDGDIGMNYITASANVDSTTSDFSATSAAPFDWVTYDQPAGEIGFQPGSGDVFGLSSIVWDRHVFYNHSIFDNFPIDDNGLDNGAVATDKFALLPGQTATFANYTSYTKGINGIAVDMFLENASLDANDFSFKVGNGGDPADWQTLNVQPTVTERDGMGTDGTDRFDVTWPDNTITGEWLQVKVLADDNTGLSVADVFYFGNAPGESGNSPTDAGVNVLDVLGARGNESMSSVPITNKWDYNRDGVVKNDDVLAARGSQTADASVLSLMTAPSTQPVSAASRMNPGDIKLLNEHMTFTADAIKLESATVPASAAEVAPITSPPLQTESAQSLTLAPAFVPAFAAIADEGISAAALLAPSLAEPAKSGAAAGVFSQVPVLLRNGAARPPLWIERPLPVHHHPASSQNPFNGVSPALLGVEPNDLLA